MYLVNINLIQYRYYNEDKLLSHLESCILHYYFLINLTSDKMLNYKIGFQEQVVRLMNQCKIYDLDIHQFDLKIFSSFNDGLAYFASLSQINIDKQLLSKNKMQTLI